MFIVLRKFRIIIPKHLFYYNNFVNFMRILLIVISTYFCFCFHLFAYLCFSNGTFYNNLNMAPATRLYFIFIIVSTCKLLDLVCMMNKD